MNANQFKALQRKCDIDCRDLRQLLNVDGKTVSAYRDGLSAIPKSVIDTMNSYLAWKG